MAILVIGGTGQIGSLVVEELVKRGAEVRVLGRERRWMAPRRGSNW
jgi:uncharacterized protein YbjT (DUF2867 family)